MPIALVSLVDSRRQWFKACYGVDMRETDRSVSMCTHALDHDGVLVVPDTMQDERFVGNPLVTGPLHIRFYAGAPCSHQTASRSARSAFSIQCRASS
ncbi:GAF domain-containing protein [Deinococcus malanensis]|uniref:GAF domain-containing protein n=1 Tax=Deinococcus malanensis TaxID=1706855 RepID=UPI0036301A8F